MYQIISCLAYLCFLLSYLPSFSQNRNVPSLLATINAAHVPDTTRILAMTELGYWYWSIKSDSTFLLANQAYQLSKKINFKKGLGRACWLKGIYYNNLGNPLKVIDYYDSALLYAKEISDTQGIGRVYNSLGQFHAELGDYEKALKYHFQSLKIKDVQDDKPGIGNSYNNIGNIYFRIGNTDKALEYCFKGLAIRKTLQDKQWIAGSENNIARIYDKLGERDKALAYFTDALKAFRETGTLRGITYTCNDIAKLYLREKRYTEAYNYLKEGLGTAEAMKSKERIADLNVTFAMFDNQVGHYEEAGKHAWTALLLARELGLLEYASSAVKELAITAFKTNQFRQAYTFQLQFNQLTDSIHNKAKIERALQEEYKFKEEKNQLEQDKKDLIYQSTSEKQRWMLYGVLCLLAGVAVIAYALYRSSLVKKNTSDLLRVQRNELVKQNAVIEEQNKLLQESKNQLEQNIETRTQDLKLANQELVNQNLQLEQFTFMTAHNLRGPVARLIGLGSLYNSENPGEPFNTEVIKGIKQSSKDLDEVIRDMTIILRTKNGIGMDFASISLHDTMTKVLAQVHQEILEKHITIKNSLNEPFIISGIGAYVHSVFYNVISNSIKYCGNSRPEIRISAIQEDHHVRIMIADNGVGFDADVNREKLFRPFTRFSTIKEGKGLGLYLIKIQMESMRGQVEIESKKYQGTSVVLIFSLPR